MNKNTVPKRVVKPDNVKYLAIDKKSFAELIQNFLAVLEKQTKDKHTVDIRVDGFDGLFKSVDDFTATLTAEEWKKLSTIRVYFYSIKDKYAYNLTLSLRFGGFSNSDPGLEIDYGTNRSDITRLAIKQDIDIFLSDFSRKVFMDDKALPLIAAIVLYFILFSSLFAFILATGKIAKIDLSDWIFFAGSLAWISFVIYWFFVFLHHKIMPHFECVDSVDNLRIKRVGKIAGKLFFFVTLISALVTIVQPFLPK